MDIKNYCSKENDDHCVFKSEWLWIKMTHHFGAKYLSQAQRMSPQGFITHSTPLWVCSTRISPWVTIHVQREREKLYGPWFTNERVSMNTHSFVPLCSLWSVKIFFYNSFISSVFAFFIPSSLMIIITYFICATIYST